MSFKKVTSSTYVMNGNMTVEKLKNPNTPKKTSM